MILSIVDVWRVEVDIIKMHSNKQELRDFQRFIGTFQIIYYNHSESGFTESSIDSLPKIVRYIITQNQQECNI